MGQDYFCVKNDDKKEYVRPSLGLSTSSLSGLLGDDYFTRVVTSLVVPAHHSDSKERYYLERLIGSWGGNELSYLTDYDQLSEVEDYKDITLETLAMLFEHNISYLDDIIARLKTNKEWLIVIGEIVELSNTQFVDSHMQYYYDKKWINEYQRMRK